MMPDGELLRRYAEANSEEAFGKLVERHLDLVYSAALRQVNGDKHLAQDVAQTVFTDLARKAAGLANRPALTGWLYTSTHFAAAKAVRTERRRHNREQEAHMMNELLHESEPRLDWEQLRPVLDTAMHQLDEADREVILLRYFENQKHAAIGERLGLTENGARMKVERALEKLRTVLARRGVTTSAALATALSANAVNAAPAGLATVIATAAVFGIVGATGAATTATAAKTAVAPTLQKALLAGVVAMVAGTGIYEARKAATLQKEIATLRRRQAPLTRQVSDLTAENTRLSNLITEAEDLRAAQGLPQSNSRGNVPPRLAASVSDLEMQLREAMKLPDDGQRQQRLAEIARAIAIAEIPAAMALAESVLTPDPERLLFQETMLMHWAESDPGKTLDFARTYTPDVVHKAIVGGALESAAVASSKGYLEDRQKFITNILQRWAGKDAGAALAWIEKLPGGAEQHNYYAVVLSVLAESDPQRALAKLKEMPAGRDRGTILERLAAGLGGKDPAAAAEFGKALPAGSSRDQFLQQVAAGWIAKDPKAAVNFILELPASGSRDELMRNAVSAWARTDGEAAAKFSETLPFNRMWSMTGVGYYWAVNDPPAAWQWSLTIRDDETRRSSLGGVLRSLATHSKLNEAATYAGQLTGDDQVRAIRSLLIDSSEMDPDWTARWVAGFPTGETRNQAVEKLVQHWSERDPMATAKWLAEQPQDASFQAGARRLIPGMIKASPATAWDWAMILSDPDVRQERLESVARSWLSSDGVGAREKILASGLPTDQISKLLTQAH